MGWVLSLLILGSLNVTLALGTDFQVNEKFNPKGKTFKKIDLDQAKAPLVPSENEGSGDWSGNTKVIKIFETPTGDIPVLLKDILKTDQIYARNGGRGPGGGDGLFCEQSSDNRFQGIYSYTYVQTRKNLEKENSDEFEFPNKSCLDNLNVIYKKLKEKNPILAVGLKDFIKSAPIQKHPKKSDHREWVSFSEGNEIQCLGADLPDENRILSTPNCRKCQLFIRDQSDIRSKLIYHYDQVFLKYLQKDPQQCSYALIHEWARDFIKGAKEVYFFTSHLHSKTFHQSGELDYDKIDEQTATCLKEMADQPINKDSLSIYLSIVSQVPPSISEVEAEQKEMVDKYNAKIGELLLKMDHMEKQHPIGLNDCMVNRILESTKTRMNEIKNSVASKKMSYADAIEALTDLSNGVYVGSNSYQTSVQMMFCMDYYPGQTFQPIDEKKPQIEMIKVKPKN